MRDALRNGLGTEAGEDAACVWLVQGTAHGSVQLADHSSSAAAKPRIASGA
jgi:hypothetical protein